MADQDFERLDFKSGDALLASQLQMLRDAILPGVAIRGSAGIDVRRSVRGDVQLSVPSGASDRMRLGVASGTITARSGTTPGAGTVTSKSVDATTGLLIDDGGSWPVFNFSSTTGGIASGTYVWISQDPDDNWWVTSVDCGN